MHPRLMTLLALAALALPAPGDTLTADFTSATSVPLTAAGYTAAGNEVNLSLSYAPTPGTQLTVVQNTGPGFITGQFSNLAHGQTVTLTYAGVSYPLVANYYGGNGRSLVLQWPCTGIAAWGGNDYHQLGNGGINNHPEPVDVVTGGVLAGRTIIGCSAGQFHSLAVTADGRVFGWGNGYLETEVSDWVGNRSTEPVAMDPGAFAGKTLVAVSAGGSISAALASDGTAYTWDTTNNTLAPAALDASGVLAGKSLVAVEAGYSHGLGLTSEGKVVAWGASGPQFGNNYGPGGGTVPAAVDTSGALAGKTITGISAGFYFSLAVSADGSVFSWGVNNFGQLGNNSTTQSAVPVAVDTSGALAGQTVIAVAAGGSHSLALAADGRVYAWGENIHGELGTGNTTRSSVPKAVDASGVLAGKKVVAIAAGVGQSLAMTEDGMVVIWGWFSGTTRLVPTVVDFGPAFANRKVGSISAGDSHNLALVDGGLPQVLRQPVNQLAAAGATATFSAAADPGYPATVRWQVSPTGPDGPFSDVTDNPSAATGTLEVSGITAEQSGWAFRAVFSNPSGSRASAAATLTLAEWSATLTAGEAAPFSGDRIIASGALTLSLGFAPPPGTNLTVILNTGTDFIAGRFSNVPQGGTVPLTWNGVTYPYVANYFGGNGRSLVLQWPLTRLAAWGYNFSGELGNGTTTDSLLPLTVAGTNGLAGRTVTQVAAALGVSMALTADGRLFAWGTGQIGRLGQGDTQSSTVPVEITATGPLAGKTVVAMSVNSYHSLALTDDGRVYAWGVGDHGQLGTGQYVYQVLTPTPVDTSGALAGKKVVAISAGHQFSLALTSEGEVMAWGYCYAGELGNGFSTQDCYSPMKVITREELAGRTIVAISAGGYQSLALASDGKLFAWGNNGSGLRSLAPAAVTMDGALAGKNVTAIATGGHDLALTADGLAFAWGGNYYGQLGIGTTTDGVAPAAVSRSGPLATGRLAAIAAKGAQSLGITTDGQCVAWGQNDRGQLGNGTTTNSPLLVAVTPGGTLAGMRAMVSAASGSHSLVLADAGPPVVTLQPFNRTAAPGATVSFAAAAAHAFGFTVRWQESLNGVAGPFSDLADNPTAATATLTLDAITVAHAGRAYRAVFSNLSGSTTTAPAVISVTEWSATLTGTLSAPLRAAGVVASGPLNLQLAFAPPAGVNLPVLENTGSEFISGRFDNLPQGGRVTLDFGGANYDFIVNYYGGNGRSLVLQWPWTGLVAWGSDGTSATTTNKTPTEISATGALAGQTVLSVAGGSSHSLAITADGRVLAWGENTRGQLGDGTATSRTVPVVVGGGALAGKTVVAVAAGSGHSMALTSEGRIYAWGSNFAGTLGTGTEADSYVPVAVDASGSLAGKQVVAIAAGDSLSVALTADGAIYHWGFSISLGDYTSTSRVVPTVVDLGALSGRTVATIAACGSHCLALTTDGLVFSWGNGNWGALGNGGTGSSVAPVPVNTTGVLAGKTVVAVAAGQSHSLALASDGMVYAWGYHTSGQLGDGSTVSSSSLPVAVSTAGVLAGRTVAAIAAVGSHSLALTADGLVVGWGANSSGQLGIGTTTNSSVPVAVDANGALAGRKIRSLAGGGSHSLALTDRDPLPVIARNPQGFTVFQASGPAPTVRFTAAAVDVFPPTVRWQESATGPAGPFSDIAGNPSASTETLVLDNISAAQHGHAFRAVFANHRGSAVTTPAAITVVAVPELVNFATAADIPLTGDHPVVSGDLTITLGFAPVPGTDLTILRNSGPAFIEGRFGNLPQGAVVPLTFSGMTHAYVVDYYGGNGGNGGSLVLHWSKTRLVSWGANSSGQLGTNSLSSSGSPVAVDATGPLAGKTVTRIAAGGSHNLALTADGQILAWGSNGYGQLGNGGSGYSAVPVAIDTTGILAGKTLVGIAAGDGHSLALTSDGTVFGWGRNAGRLGSGTMTDSAVPVAVNASGGLAGQQLVAVAAGGGHSLALTATGRVFAWGAGTSGQLGTGAATTSLVPVEVLATGALSGKIVTAIAAGSSHSLALTADGRVYAWGANAAGQLGCGSGVPNVSNVPVAVSATGVLAGKTVVAIAAGRFHSAVLTADGKVFTWGMGQAGQLGNNGTTSNSLPVAVTAGGAATGKTVTSLAAGGNHCLTLASDGRAYAWGDNQYYQLGDNSFSYYSTYPVAVTTTGAISTRRTMAVAGGGTHSLALVGVGYVPTIASQPEDRHTSVGASVSLTAAATGLPAPTVRWQVSSKGSVGPFSNISGNATATATTLVLTGITAAQQGYSYRAVFTNVESSATTTAATLTVHPVPVLTLPANPTVVAVTRNGAAVNFETSALDSFDGPVLTQCTPPSGTVFPLGTTTVQCAATNSLGGVATGSFTVTVLRSFAAFQDQYQLAGGPEADPFDTGLANLTAYAFGMNPATPDRTRLPVVTVADGYLQISYDRWRDAADLQYVVETSDDLQLWQSGSGHLQTLSVTPLDASRERVIERSSTAVAGAARRFIRIRLVR